MKLSKKALGLATGIMWGGTIFLITNFLLLRGSQGEHISLLSNFYFGYRFSFWGSFIGLIWGFIDGFICGWLFALIYNLFIKSK
ncbi:MAG: bacteriophage holin [Candidatus Aminicenantia bacterium]